MVAPDHLDIEVVNALRGLVRSRQVSEPRASEAVDDLRSAPLERLSTAGLVGEVWRRRENLAAYDAAYVVVAELLGCALVTADGRLRRAAGSSVQIELV